MLVTNILSIWYLQIHSVMLEPKLFLYLYTVQLSAVIVPACGKFEIFFILRELWTMEIKMIVIHFPHNWKRLKNGIIIPVHIQRDYFLVNNNNWNLFGRATNQLAQSPYARQIVFVSIAWFTFIYQQRTFNHNIIKLCQKPSM